MSEKELREITMEEMIEQNKTYLGFIENRYKEIQKRCEKLNDRCEYIELNSYGEGIKKGEQLMQEKVDKIIDYWVNNPSILTQWFGSETTLFQLLEKTKQTCERIEYEKEKEQEIHVGDEVVDKNGKKYVVIHLVGVFMYAMSSSGESYTFVYSDVSKTGKHYPIEEMLKELK